MPTKLPSAHQINDTVRFYASYKDLKRSQSDRSESAPPILTFTGKVEGVLFTEGKVWYQIRTDEDTLHENVDSVCVEPKETAAPETAKSSSEG